MQPHYKLVNHTMKNLIFACALFAPALAAQNNVACFEFDGATLSSTTSSIATTSDLSVSNDFMFGGAGDSWLCLTTQWNNTGGQLSFTVTPNAGESLNYGTFSWSAVTGNAAASDSIAAVTVLANGEIVGVVDPVTHNTVHTFDLSTFAALQGASGAITFVMDCTGNPTGQSAYEMDFIKLTAEPCVLAIGNVAPTVLPIVTRDCFMLTGDCFDQVTQVEWAGDPLPVCEPANWGKGCYEIINANTIRICPPLCEDAGSYTVKLTRGNGETSSTNVELVVPVEATIACPETHPAGTDLCLFVSSGQLPQPNAIFVILSPSNTPSIVPGVIEMGLGNMLQIYQCGPAHISECVEECYYIPPTLVGQTWYFQSIIWNPFQTILPLPVTNLCSTTFE